MVIATAAWLIVCAFAFVGAYWQTRIGSEVCGHDTYIYGGMPMSETELNVTAFLTFVAYAFFVTVAWIAAMITMFVLWFASRPD
jgi:hypothetical protein